MAAAPPPPPYEPTDSIKIATPAQAAQAVQTPALNPAIQCALLTGLLQAAGGVEGSAIPLVMVDAAMKGMAPMTYTLDLKNDQEPLTSTGAEKIAGASFTNGPGTDLRLSLDAKAQTLHLDGKLGGYATHLETTMNAPADKADDVQGFHTEGSVGGQAYQMDTNFHIDPNTRPPAPPPTKKMNGQPQPQAEEAPGPIKLPPPEKGTLEATGHVGQSKIGGHYAFSEQAQTFGATMDFKDQDSNVRLTLIA
jgi:hypothetical protein